MIKYEELDKIGIDGDEIKYPKREVKMSEPSIEDEMNTAIENEKQKFIDSIEKEIGSMAGVMNSTNIRALHDKLGDYLYHEANNFSELIERN